MNRPYVLPTEAEWEYACRSSTTTVYSWGNNITASNVNYNQSGIGQTRDDGRYAANPWGFFDMHGNVMEWVNDYYARDYSHAVGDIQNPQGPSKPENLEYPLRVVRGGAWGGHHDAGTAEGIRVSKRYAFPPWVQSFQIGFRCATEDPKAETKEP